MVSDYCLVVVVCKWEKRKCQWRRKLPFQIWKKCKLEILITNGLAFSLWCVQWHIFTLYQVHLLTELWCRVSVDRLGTICPICHFLSSFIYPLADGLFWLHCLWCWHVDLQLHSLSWFLSSGPSGLLWKRSDRNTQTLIVYLHLNEQQMSRRTNLLLYVLPAW